MRESSSCNDLRACATAGGGKILPSLRLVGLCFPASEEIVGDEGTD